MTLEDKIRLYTKIVRAAHGILSAGYPLREELEAAGVDVHKIWKDITTKEDK